MVTKFWTSSKHREWNQQIRETSTGQTYLALQICTRRIAVLALRRLKLCYLAVWSDGKYELPTSKESNSQIITRTSDQDFEMVYKRQRAPGCIYGRPNGGTV